MRAQVRLYDELFLSLCCEINIMINVTLFTSAFLAYLHVVVPELVLGF